MCSEDSYNYTRTKGTCLVSSCTARLVQRCVIGFQDVTVRSAEALLTALAQQLVSVAIEADSVLTLTQSEDPHDQSDRHNVRLFKLQQAV